MKGWIGGLLLGILALSPHDASAMVVYAPWVYTVAAADVIVAGKVVEADIVSGRRHGIWDDEQKPGPTLQVVVDDVIYGTCSVGDKLKVSQVRRDCLPYWTSFPLGQRVVLLLNRGETTNSPWTMFRDYDIVAAGDQEYVVGVDGEGVPYWNEAFALREFRTAIADFRVSFRFVYAPEPIDARSPIDGNPEILPCDRIDFVSSQPAPTKFRKRYPPGTTPPVVPFRDRSAVHAMLYDKVQAERRKIAQHQQEFNRLRAAAAPSL